MSTSIRIAARLAATAVLAASAVLGTGLTASPAAAAQPAGPSGPVIVNGSQWLERFTPTSGVAQRTFNYGRSGDLPVLGDWNADGSETPGMVRGGGTTWHWLLRNSNTAGSADIAFDFGEIRFVSVDRLGSIPIAGNFDPSDEAYEVGVVLFNDVTGQITWQIRRDLTPTSPVLSFSYGRTSTDFPVVGDWNGDGVDTAGVIRSPNQWLLTNTPLAGGNATVVFRYGASDPQIRELHVSGDWDGNGTDTPAVLRNVPATQAEGPHQQWLFRNSNSGGAANGSFIFGGAAQTVPLPIEFVPRLAIEIGAA